MKPPVAVAALVRKRRRKRGRERERELLRGKRQVLGLAALRMAMPEEEDDALMPHGKQHVVAATRAQVTGKTYRSPEALEMRLDQVYNRPYPRPHPPEEERRE